MAKERVIWIDVLKGIAIILVVIGHNSADDSFIACFHMPLFFLVSGWLFSPKPLHIYFKKSIFRFLLPYFCFLICIAFPQLLSLIIRQNWTESRGLLIRLAYGGYYLQGLYAVFWFITVLWMSQNLFNLIISKRVKPCWLSVLIFIAYLAYLTPLPLPWNIHVVPMATVYIWIGYLLKQREETLYSILTYQRVATFIISVILLALIYKYRHILTFSMKYGEAGIPILSLLTSIVGAVIVALLAIFLSRYSIIVKIFSFIGMASMVIMYLHMPVKFYFTMKIVPSETYFVHILCGIVISLVAYVVMSSIKFTRKYFLGNSKPVHDTD